MNNFEVQILQPSGTILEIETINGDNSSNIEIIQSGNPILQITNDVALLPAEFNTLVNAQIDSFLNAGSGIILSSTPTGLIISSANDTGTVKNIIAGSGISVLNTSGIFTIATTGDFGLTTEQVDDRVASLIKAGNYSSIVYDDLNNILTISVSGLQPSGDYSLLGHSHSIADVSGLQNALDSKQPSGVYASGIHYHTSSDITDFNSAVSGLIPPSNFTSLSGISGVVVTNSGTDYYVSLLDPSIQLQDITDLSNNAKTFLLTPSSSNLSNLISDETGSGLLVFNNSPALSGTPTAPTAPSGTNNTQIANTQFVRTEISNLVNSAPSTLDTLNELASALGNDPNFATTVASGLGQKANLSGATFTGPISGPSGNFSILQQSGINVSVSGHTHQYTDIINFASGIDDAVSTLLQAGSYISLNYNNINDTLTIAATGVQPSGNYSVVGHTHTSSNITDFNSSVSGLLPVKDIIGSGYINISSSSGNYIVSATGLQPSGNYSLFGHSHLSTDISDSTSFGRNILTAASYEDQNYLGWTIVNTSTSSFTAKVGGKYYFPTVPFVGPPAPLTCTVNDPASGSAGQFYHIIRPSGGYNSIIVGGTTYSTSSGIFLERYWSVDNVFPLSGSWKTRTLSDYHNHTSNQITDFNSSVSGLLPVKDILAGTYINVTSNSGIYTINSTGEANLLETTVFNKTGSSIPKLSVVYINGGQGDQPTIALASASGEAASSKTYGITAENINNMSTGKVIVAGALTGVNTDQFNPTAPQGDINGTTLWLSPTVSGGLTRTKPSAPYHMVSVGTVVRTHQNEGVIEVRIQNGFELEELHNVAISGLANNQFIKYDSSTSLWKNVTAIAGDISDFNSSVSGLLPVTNILGGTNISVVPSGSSYTVNVSGSLGLTTEEVDDRVANLLVAGSGINLDYNDSSNILTIAVSGISGGSSADEIEEYAATSNFPASGNLNILYVATDTAQLYKWDGEVYYEAGPQGASTGTHGTQHESDGSDPLSLTEYNVPEFTANTNNLNHLNKDILYITADANNRELTGLLAPTFCCVKLLVNISSTNTIIIDNQSTNSDPANRFLNYTGSDYYLLPGRSLSVLYSTEAMRWRIL